MWRKASFRRFYFSCCECNKTLSTSAHASMRSQMDGMNNDKKTNGNVMTVSNAFLKALTDTISGK